MIGGRVAGFDRESEKQMPEDESSVIDDDRSMSEHELQ